MDLKNIRTSKNTLGTTKYDIRAKLFTHYKRKYSIQQQKEKEKGEIAEHGKHTNSSYVISFMRTW